MFKYTICFLKNMFKKGISANVLNILILAAVVALVLLLIIWGVKNSVLG